LKTNIFLNNFPGSNPRPQQVEALEKIQQAFSSKKFVIARLPTGSGKSHIATAIARSSRPIDTKRRHLIESYDVFNRDKQDTLRDIFTESQSFGSYILTVTRSLQDQYLELFPEQIAAKGKNNYNCDVDKNVTVDFAPCLVSHGLKHKCFEADRCSYFKTHKNALTSQDPVLNYKSFFNLPNFLQHREYLIFDEADKIESELVSLYSVTLNYAQLKSEEIIFKKIISDDRKEAGIWLTDIYMQVKEKLAEVKQKVSFMSNKNNTFDGILFKQIQRVGKLTGLYNQLMDAVLNWDEADYLVEYKDAKEVTLVPYNIKNLAQDIFSRGEKILLMSATISNPAEYAKSLGIGANEYTFLDVKSSFDSSRSPIYCSTKYNLSHKTLETYLPKIIEMVKDICDNHKGEKGIIHTHSNNITDMVYKYLHKNKRFLFREAGVTNMDIMNEHKSRISEDTVLVSPSLDTGISLDDELGRFQIILKAPYLPLGSKRIKKLFDKNPSYYTMKMLDSLIQMSGRCTRSVEDYSVTYILDGTAVKAIKSNKTFLPKYFLDRFM
jgi:Rad3-related DNA helicase